MHNNIIVLYETRNFEHDVYALLKAFYPTCEILTKDANPDSDLQELQNIEDAEFLLRVMKDGSFELCDSNHKIVKHIEGREENSQGQSLREEVALVSSVLSSDERMQLRKQEKDFVKITLYKLLSEYTGKSLPWGNLTGIRPTKLAMAMLEAGMKNTEIADHLRKLYFVSPKKTALAVTIANRERELLKEIDYENGYSLYIGIPFCPSICLYCSFSSFPLERWKNQVDAYLDALFYEMQEIGDLMKKKGRKLDTIYIGGGTPTTLEADQLERLMQQIETCFTFEGLKEFTVEAGRPDSITRAKLEALRKYPVSRISVNPQTMNQSTLDLIGRRHTVEETKNTFLLARECGFDNINMDLIIGLPGEDTEMIKGTLDEIRALEPDSLTIHSLAVKRAARLNLFKEKYQEMTIETNQEMIDMTMSCAYEMGMGPYYMYRQKNMAGNFENVGYAKAGYEGLYNILIMEEKQTILAAGAGSSTKRVYADGRIERAVNVKDVKLYMETIDKIIEDKAALLE